MSSKSATFSKSALKEKLHKKAKLTSEPARKPILKTTPRTSTPKQKVSQPHARASGTKDTKASAPVRKDLKGKTKALSLPEDEDDDSRSSLPTSFKIIAGSYEKLLYGLEGTVGVDGASHTFRLKPMFIFPAHMSYIRAVAASPNGGKWLATGSGDEIIKVWDLRRRREIGGLMQHEGESHLCLS